MVQPSPSHVTAESLRGVFPFDPYDIQLEFMKHLYNCVETHGLGLFESPTGTGKTLSIISGLIAWLRHHEAAEEAARLEIERQHHVEEARSDKENDPGGSEPAWLRDSSVSPTKAPAPAPGDAAGAAGTASAGPRAKMQVIYAARTHSQLTQFMGALLGNVSRMCTFYKRYSWQSRAQPAHVD
jgi:hypothetical protein